MKIGRMTSNPELICQARKPFKIRGPQKCYLAMVELRGFPMVSKRKFKRATEAEEYGERLAQRYRRLYAAHLAGGEA